VTDTKTGTLREAISSTILDAWRAMPDGETFGEAAARFTDKILALPELAALIADADNWRRVTTGDPTEPEPLAMQARELLIRNRELEATVARVRELHDQLLTIAHDSESLTAVIYRQNADRLTRALDGEPQP
jgi:hypothetical protein